MYNGTTKRLSLQKNVICSRCDGRGGKEGAVNKCSSCRGTGVQVKVHQIGPGMMQQVNFYVYHLSDGLIYILLFH